MLQQLDTAIGFSVVMLMLSLLVTAAVQVISAVLDLRGKNLVRGLADLFHQIDPGLRNSPASPSTVVNKILEKIAHPFSNVTVGSRLAEAVATHPAISHTFTRAKAIRKDELLAVLQDLRNASTQGRIDDETKLCLQKAVESRVPGGSATVAALQELVDQLGSKFPAVQNEVRDQLKNGLQEVFGNVARLETEVGKWFDTIMDRTSDVFTRWTRVITVTVTILLVVILHIDSGEILRQISASPELRAGLAKMSDATIAQADKIFDNRNRASKALSLLAEKHKNETTASFLGTAPKDLVSCVDGKEWIDEHSKPPVQDQLRQEFSDSCEEQARLAMGASGEQLRQINADLKATNLRIIPEKINGNPVFTYPEKENETVAWTTHCWHLFGNWTLAYSSKRHFVGTLASVFLLSLGAPFWFNALKQMSNLKPTITSKIEKEQ